MIRLSLCTPIFCLALCRGASGQSGALTTIAGTGSVGGDGGPATSAELNIPAGVAVDANGNVFIADTGNFRIRKVTASGTIATVAGNGSFGFGGDGGQATAASMGAPTSVAVDTLGNLYFADLKTNRIRKVSGSGVITTVAGNGTQGFSGDGGQATAASLRFPGGVAADAFGNLFIADTGNNRIRKVASNGVITTVAGNGAADFSGDNNLATSAALSDPAAVVADTHGNLFIADARNNRVRKVSAAGVITTVAGNGSRSYTGDGGQATSASLNHPAAVALDAYGNLFIGDSGNEAMRKVSTTGVITTVAGNGRCCFAGDGGLATSASLYAPTGAAVDAYGNLFIADSYNNRIREVSTSGFIATVAGSGVFGQFNSSFGGDGGAATSALLSVPAGVAVDPYGNIFVADTGNSRIRKVSGGVITTVAGNHAAGFSGDGGLATSASLAYPSGVAADSHGDLFIADTKNSVVRKVSPGGVITTVAGNGSVGYNGDGGPAIYAALSYPTDLAVDASGNLFIADAGNSVVRKVSADGAITTVAGNGGYGYAGDGGQATAASLGYPGGIAVNASGELFIADVHTARVRKVSAGGIITTVAGNGNSGFSGDGGPATAASLTTPSRVAVDTEGNLYIADSSNNRIRKVSADGTITTVAGNGGYGYSAASGPATSVTLSYPADVAVDSFGNLLIADTGNSRIRCVGGPSNNFRRNRFCQQYMGATTKGRSPPR